MGADFPRETLLKTQYSTYPCLPWLHLLFPALLLEEHDSTIKRELKP